MNKKADLSIGIIIAAAIGVLVLVVIGAVFINQMKNTTQDIKTDCSKIGGKMVEINSETTSCSNGKTEITKYSNTTHLCCADLGFQ